MGWGLLVAALSALLPVDYTLIAQRPDYAGAVHVPYTKEFAACCSAFSASSINLPAPPPLADRLWDQPQTSLPIQSVWLTLHMTAETDEDAARLLVRVWDDTLPGGFEDRYSVPVAPSIQGGPRTVGGEFRSMLAGVHGPTSWVVQFKGRPTVYGATLRVTYEVQ